MKILKVIRDENCVQFRHEVQGHQATEERDHICHEAPLKEFDDALQGLADAVVNVLEVGQPYKKGITVIALSLSYTKKGTRSAAITFTKELEATGAAHRLTTPLFQFDDAAEGEDNKSRRQCTKRHAEQIQTVIECTEQYANGERQQRLLPLNEDDSAEPKAGDVLKFTAPEAGKDGEGSTDSEETKTKKRNAK